MGFAHGKAWGKREMLQATSGGARAGWDAAVGNPRLDGGRTTKAEREK